MVYNNIEVAPVLMYGNKTKYVVTKDGQVINIVTGKHLKRKIDSKGYYKVTLSENGIHQDKRVHVLVALGFVENPNPEKFTIVNHKDGNKLNPYYTNLEWTDYSGNVQHAIKNGLIHFLNEENAPRAILTNSQVEEMCKLMEEGELTQREIARKFNVDEYLVREIKLGNNWKTISSKYNISNCKNGNVKNLTPEIAHKVCEELVKNELTIRQIADKYEVPYDSVLGVANYNYYTYISDNYDFSSYDKIRKGYSKELMEKVRSMILNGKTNPEIIKECNLESSNKIAMMLYRERRRISKL